MSGFRWRLRRAVEEALLRTGESHPLRRAWRVLRRAPFVSAAWRAAVRNDAWRDVDQYAARGGVFAPALIATSADAPQSPPVAFEDPRFFERLFAAAAAPYDPAPGRILIVSNGLSSGGAERQIVYTVKGFRTKGLDIHYRGEMLDRAPGFDFYADDMRSAGAEPRGIEMAASPGGDLYRDVTMNAARLLARAPAPYMTAVLDSIRMMKSVRPEIVHVWLDDAAAKHGVAAALAGAPRIVLSGRSLEPSHFDFYAPHMRPAYAALARRLGVVLTNNSRAGAKSYAAWLGLDEGDIRVIYNAFDPSAWKKPDRAAARERLGVGDAEILVFGALRHAAEKQPLLWIDAARAALRMDSRLRFVLAGDGPLRQEAEARARSGGERNLTFVGETRAIADYLGAADIVLLTSKFEGTPNILIEAQWHGVPVVSTGAGGASESFEHGVTGVLCPDDNAEDIARRLCAFASDPSALSRASTAGPEFVRRRFAMDRMIADTLSVYGMKA